MGGTFETVLACFMATIMKQHASRASVQVGVASRDLFVDKRRQPRTQAR